MGDNQQERGLFSGVYNKIHGVKTESTTWDGNYGNTQQQNSGNQGYQNDNYNQGQNQYNQGQGQYNQGQNQGQYQGQNSYNQGQSQCNQGQNQGQNQYNQGQNQGQNQYNQGQNQGQNQYSQGQNQSNQGNYQPPYNSGSSQPVKYNPSAGMNPPAGSNNTTSNTSSQNCNQSSGGSLSVGAIVALKNNNTGRFLSSQPIRYQGGSGQQQVTANQWSVSDCDKWQLVSGFNQPNASNGSLINFNQIIRLRHQGTGCYLHSHPNINSPLSQYQEVSGYGDGNNSDDNDNWVLEKFTYNSGQENGAADFGSAFKLRHCKTGMYLYSHERTMQVNGATHAEVACYGNGNDESNKWRFQLA